MGYIKSVMKPGYRIMVSLKAAKGKEVFYKKFCFIGRPNGNFGAGMHIWLEKQLKKERSFHDYTQSKVRITSRIKA